MRNLCRDSCKNGIVHLMSYPCHTVKDYILTYFRCPLFEFWYLGPIKQPSSIPRSLLKERYPAGTWRKNDAVLTGHREVTWQTPRPLYAIKSQDLYAINSYSKIIGLPPPHPHPHTTPVPTPVWLTKHTHPLHFRRHFGTKCPLG